MTDIIKLLRDLPGTRPEPEPFEVWREACGLAAAAADEIEQLRATLTLQQASYERERAIDEEEIERLRAALTELVACHTESAGWSMSMMENRAAFDAMLERSQKRVDDAVDAARAALEKP